jgi:hypothetical protein
MGRTTESSRGPGSSRSTAEPTGGCTVPVGSLVVLLLRRLVGPRRGPWATCRLAMPAGSASSDSDHRPRQKEDSITVGASRLEVGGTARSSAPVQDLPSVNNACDQYSREIRINTARKCERPRRSLYDGMAEAEAEAEAVQDGGERGVQDGADRLEAVTALASRRSATTIASAAVPRRARCAEAGAVCRGGRGPSTRRWNGTGTVTPYPPPRRVHQPDWLPSRAPTGQVIACVVPSGSAQASPA